MNFDLLLLMLGIASLVNLMHSTPIYHNMLDRFNINFKPFSCVMCTSFWISLGYFLVTNPYQSIFIAGITAILAELICIQIHKL